MKVSFCEYSTPRRYRLLNALHKNSPERCPIITQTFSEITLKQHRQPAWRHIGSKCRRYTKIQELHIMIRPRQFHIFGIFHILTKYGHKKASRPEATRVILLLYLPCRFPDDDIMPQVVEFLVLIGCAEILDELSCNELAHFTAGLRDCRKGGGEHLAH